MASDPVPPRRRFQFRLRTLFVVVTVLCVVGGYAAIQARIALHRKELWSEWHGRGGSGVRMMLVTDIEEAHREMQVQRKPLTDAPRVPWIRECLGDFPVWLIWYWPNRIPASLLDELKAYFPEAIFERGDQPSTALRSLRTPPPQN
jgi:hypothetical protein